MEDQIRRMAGSLWHWAWLIVIGTVLTAGSAYIGSRLTPPVYSTSTKLLINEAPQPRSADASSILINSDRLGQTYSDMMVQQPVLDKVIGTLGLNLTAGQLAGAVRVGIVKDTQLLRLTVESEDPAQAAAIANTIPAVFRQQNADLQAQRYADSKANLTRDLETLNEQIDRAQANSMALSTSLAERDRLQTELVQLRQSYASLRQSYETIQLAEAQSTSNIVVTEPAQVPTVPVRPRTLQNTLTAGLAGLILAIGLVYLLEYLDDRVRSPDQAQRLLNAPVIGLIARMNGNGKDKAKRLAEGAETTLVTVKEPRSPVVEAFRALRTNIQFAGVDEPVRTLLITSPGPAEGKSTIAANLGVVMAQAGLRVVVVDADLRRPAQQRLFNRSGAGQLGLTDLMLQPPGPMSLDGAMQATDVPNLSVLTSGPLPPNPSELLGSQRMQSLLANLKEQFDVVIIDTAPLLPVTDALVLSAVVDGVALVVNSDATRAGATTQARQQLEQAGARVIGVVMNKLTTRRGGYHYTYYYHYYSDHSEDGKIQSRRRAGVAADKGNA